MEESARKADFAHAQKVWNEFNIQDLRQYHDLYLTLDVFLLQMYSKTFAVCNYYELDPCHYYTIPVLSFDACLKMT